MQIQAVRVGDQTIRPLRVILTQPVELEQHLAPEASATKALLAGVTAGTTAKYAWHGFQATNTLGIKEMTDLLVQNGVAPQHAPAVAEQALAVIRAEPTKALLVAVSASGTIWAALEASSKLFGMRVSVLKKIALSVSGALLAGAGYHYLRSHGYFQ